MADTTTTTTGGQDAKRKTRVARIVALTVSILLSGLLLEGAVRLLMPAYSPCGNVVFRMTPEGVPLAIPNFSGRQWKTTGDYDVRVMINHYGFRDSKDLKTSRKDDIFVVGDSFSFGWGVEEDQRFSNRLEALLGVPVFNISIPTDIRGYRKLVAYAQRRGARVGNLIVGLCMENDIADYEDPSYDAASKAVSWPIRNEAKVFLALHSAAYNALTTVVHKSRFLDAAAKKLGIVVDNIAGMDRNDYDPAAIRSSVQELKELTKDVNAVVLVIPSRGLWTGDRVAVERKVHDEFIAVARAAGLLLVDMRPIVEATGNPLGMHFKRDGHWVPSGHEAAARELAKALPRRQGRDSEQGNQMTWTE
jgi:hypothetical protein